MVQEYNEGVSATGIYRSDGMFTKHDVAKELNYWHDAIQCSSGKVTSGRGMRREARAV